MTTLLQKISTKGSKINFVAKESFLHNRVKLCVVIETQKDVFEYDIDFEGQYNYFEEKEGTLSFPTSIENIKNDLEKIFKGEKFGVSSKEMLHEYLMIIRHICLYQIKIEDSIFKKIFDIDNYMWVSCEELKKLYDCILKIV